MEIARGRVEAQIGSYNHLRNGETDLIRSANLNPEVVLGPRLALPPPGTIAAPSQSGTQAPQQPAALPPGIPAGSTYVGTRNGNPVYDVPGRGRVMVTP
jgi:hypothetical protein